MQHYSDNVQDLQGNARAGVPVSVYSGAALATIYADNGNTVKANPMSTGSDGAFDFYAANGTYTVTAGGSSKTVTLFDVAAAPSATPTSSSTVLGETAGVVRRFAVDELVPLVSVFRYLSAAQIADVVANTRTLDLTTAIQAAITAEGSGGALYCPPGGYLISNLIFPAAFRFYGAGRHQTNFWVKTGTTGKVMTDNGSAAKLILEGFAVYGQDVAGVTHLLELGGTVQFGTEGYLRDLWLRDTSGYGLYVNANVGIFSDITAQACANGGRILGNANQVSGLVAMECATTGLDLSGCVARKLHIEATTTGGLPLKIYGDTTARDVVISSSNGATHSHLIEVDTAAYADWALHDVHVIGYTPTISNGVLKVGSTYHGGTSTTAFTGASYTPALVVHAGDLQVKYQKWQAFNFRLFNDGGTIKHRIGAAGGSAVAGSFHSKISGASTTLQATPAGADASTAFVAGAKIGNPTSSLVVLDTAAQVAADCQTAAHIVFNSTGTALTCWAYPLSLDVNGTTRVRLVVQFHDAATGATYDLTTIPSGKILEVVVTGFIA